MTKMKEWIDRMLPRKLGMTIPDEVNEQIDKVAKVIRETIEQIPLDWEFLQLLVHPRSQRVVSTQEELAKHYERRMRAKLGYMWKDGRWDGNRPIVIELEEE